MIPGKQYTPELIFQIAWRRKWLIVIPAVAIAAVATAVTYNLPNLYRSETLILVVPQQVPENYVRSTQSTGIQTRLQSISQQILSRTRLERIIQDFNLYTEERTTEIMEDIVERMRTRDIGLEIVKGDAFRLSFTADDPRDAMRVTERLASLFIDESLRDREVVAEGTTRFLDAQVEDVRRRLLETEKKLEDYRRQHDGELPSQQNANLQGLHNTQLQLQALTDSLNRDRDRRLVLERLIADAEIDATQRTPSPSLSAPVSGDNQFPGTTATDQLEAAQAALQRLELRFKPEHPDVVRLRRAVAELQKRVETESGAQPLATPLTPAEMLRRNRLNESRSELARLDREIDLKVGEEKRLRAIGANYQRRAEASLTRESELTELMRDYDTLQGTYRTLNSKKEESQLSANLERRQIGEQFKVIDSARLPERPSSPNRPRLYSLGIAAALAIGLGIAALFEYLDRTMRSEDDVKTALNLPVLATIPRVRAAGGKRRTKLAAAAIIMLAGIIIGATVLASRFLR